jgi:sterol desaturase/sphingolipid hydroxylase (fatty acid hydroxylase superfamily)
VQHLNFAPKSKFLQRIKRLHLQHHFHNEQGNYGITNYAWDKLFGTYYGAARERQKSATVFNLGYTEDEALRYPWVAALSHGTRGDGNPRRFRVASSEN